MASIKNSTKALKGFTIRVYGILIDDQKGILVADEAGYGKRFTKFPGGGLEWGEGTKDCLIREWKEELGFQIEIIEHFYTTDFFQISAFDASKQVISIYYLVKGLRDLSASITKKPFDFETEKETASSFRWITQDAFHESQLTFPIDRVVGKMIREILLK